MQISASVGGGRPPKTLTTSERPPKSRNVLWEDRTAWSAKIHVVNPDNIKNELSLL